MTRFNDAPWVEAGKNQPNFMTPSIVGRGRSGDWAWELSSGSGFEPGTTIYGCTFLLWDGTAWTDGPSEMRHTLGEARAYIAQVVGGVA